MLGIVLAAVMIPIFFAVDLIRYLRARANSTGKARLASGAASSQPPASCRLSHEACTATPLSETSGSSPCRGSARPTPIDA